MQGKRLFALAAIIGSVLALTVFVGACDDDEEGGEATATSADGTAAEPTSDTSDGTGDNEAIGIQLAEFTVTADAPSAAAGSLTFNVQNTGGTPHEFMIVSTDLDPGALPTTADGNVDESQVDIVDEIEESDLPAQSDVVELTVNLDAGSYALICNVLQEVASGEPLAHYTEGMHTGFEVTE
jgi:hypothetical protein